jgi:hypothetical protein
MSAARPALSIGGIPAAGGATSAVPSRAAPTWAGSSKGGVPAAGGSAGAAWLMVFDECILGGRWHPLPEKGIIGIYLHKRSRFGVLKI